LAGHHGFVLEPQQLPAGLKGRAERAEQPAGELGAHATLTHSDAEVNLLGPEIFGPDLAVHLIEVLDPAWPAVGRGVQTSRPVSRRIAAMRDPKVHLRVGHPDA